MATQATDSRHFPPQPMPPDYHLIVCHLRSIRVELIFTGAMRNRFALQPAKLSHRPAPDSILQLSGRLIVYGISPHLYRFEAHCGKNGDNNLLVSTGHCNSENRYTNPLLNHRSLDQMLLSIVVKSPHSYPWRRIIFEDRIIIRFTHLSVLGVHE